jgi:amidase
VPPLDRRRFLQQGGALLALAAAGVPGRSAFAADDALGDHDALALAELVRRGELTPAELASAAITRIERVDPKLGAVVTPLFERGLERARGPLPDGPFRGVPTLLKVNTPYAGARVTFGSAFFAQHVAQETHAVARRMEQAGFVVLGLTNASEFGLLPTTEPRLHGPTRNPWDLARSPGGSSGGSAAAVAARLVPLAQGSDGGGSIRIPASACGLFGLKVSRGRDAQAPSPDPLGLGVVHGLTRSVRDSAALLDAIGGAGPGDRWFAPAPTEPYRAAIARPPASLRIAWSASDFLGRPAHPDCVDAVQGAAKLCQELGHTVEEARPALDGEAFNQAFVLLWAVSAAEVIEGLRRRLGGRPPREGFEPWTWGLVELAARHTPADVLLALDVTQRAAYALAEFHERHDVLLTPVLGEPPVPTGWIDQGAEFEALVAQLTRYVAYTPLANATGAPAMSLPLHWNAEGLPIGAHFQARFGDEATLLRLAAQLEAARPWTGRRPPLCA